MRHTRRQLIRAAIAAPVVLAMPGALAFAQDAPPAGALFDPGNVFISPCGRPFRAKKGAPYPVVNWFNLADLNEDGQVDRAEFMADTLAFFKILDRNGDGVITPSELAYYEQRIAPEVLGQKVDVQGDVLVPSPRLQPVQGFPGGGGGLPGGGQGGPPQGSRIEPDLDSPSGSSGSEKPYDASGAGASPYSFFDEPEPVSAADTHYRGVISKADFLQLAGVHFTALDPKDRGYLTLDTLPLTPVQRRLEHGRRRRS
jgi:hypothetical protein